MNELNDVDKVVIRTIAEVVKERGADWVYPVARTTDPDYEEETDWHEASRTGCVNLKLDGSAACIIGAIAVKAGLPTERVSTAQRDGLRWGVSRPVLAAMCDAQYRQDDMNTWGAALEEFDYILLYNGVTQEQIDQIRGVAS